MTFTQNLRGRLWTERTRQRQGSPGGVATGSARSPITLPGVTHVRVTYLPFVSLLVQEVKHVFDSQWESRSSVGGAKHRFKEVVHELLQGALKAAGAGHGILKQTQLRPPPCLREGDKLGLC